MPELDLGNVMGPQGLPGAPGAAGQDGRQGDQGEPGRDASINGVNALQVAVGQGLKASMSGTTYSVAMSDAEYAAVQRAASGGEIDASLSKKVESSASNKFMAPQEFRCTVPGVTEAGIVLATDMLTGPNSSHRACMSFVNQGIVAGVLYLNTDGAFCAKVERNYDATLALAIPPQEYDLPLAAGLSNDNHFARSVYWKDQFGVVTFFFQIIKSGTSADIGNGEKLAILPAGFRPKGLANFAAHFEDTGNFVPALGVVYQDGSIVAYNGSNTSGRKVFGFGSFVAETL